MNSLTLPPLYADLPTPTSFRVLHLEPGSYRDDVVATLEVADLLVPPEYRALSYVCVLYFSFYPSSRTLNLWVLMGSLFA